jgi:hypothetical protein
MNDDTVEQLFWPAPARSTSGTPEQHDLGSGRPAMGDVVILRSTPVDITSDVGRQFVMDCTRAAEGLLTDKELAEKYELSPADWQSITKDKALGRAIRAERERRVLTGAAAREAAAKHFVRAPTILAGIMENEHSNPRHVIEAAKEIRAVAAVGSGAERLPESERFIIRIDLTAGGGDVETYDKPLKPMKISISDGDAIPLEGKSDGDK